MSSELLFKVVAHSYCRYHDQNNIMEDCINAITNQIKNLDDKISTQLKQITEVLSLSSQQTQNQMSIIIEEQSERSFHENQHECEDDQDFKKYSMREKDKNSRMSYQKKMNKIKQKYNVQIRKINKVESKVDKLIGIYKTELLDISKQATQWEQQIKKLKKQKKNILKQNNDLKDQITLQSANFLLAQPLQSQQSSQIPNQMGENIQSVFSYDKRGKKQMKQQSVFKYKIRSQSQSQQRNTGNLQRKSIKKNNNNNVNPEGSSKISKQKKQNKNERGRKNQEEAHENKKESKTKQIAQDMEKWKKLSKKIDELKTKLLTYEQELEEKEQTIKKLRQQIKQIKAAQNNEQQQKRKIKTSNTTLRGEKTVLLNQINSLKKQLVQKSQFSTLMQSENIQLKKQVQTFCQTIKWQSNAIEELNEAVKQKQMKNNSQSAQTINNMQRVNEILYKALCEQQEQVLEIGEKIRNIQQLYEQKINGMRGKVAEMEMILDEKNAQIVKMKSKNNQSHGIQNVNPNIHNGYLGQLVKVLTKKVADRDQIIRKLEER